MIALGLAASHIVLAGCAAKHVQAPGQINYTVGPECHPSAKLIHCNSDSPPRCQFNSIKFDHGCEKVVVK